MTHPLPLTITRHALERWQSRVDQSSSPTEAGSALGRFLALGRRRSTPRHWTISRAAPRTTFVYWSGRPGVCAVVVDRAVVTVLTRELCRGHTRPKRQLTVVKPRGCREAELPWRWLGFEEEAA